MEVIKDEEGLDIELDINLQKRNLELSEANKKLLDDHGILSIDFMGSVGSGKTSLMDRLIEKLKDHYKIGVIGGDLATTIDMEILGKHNIPVVQINTGRECHLDANLVAKALEKLDLNELDLLFIENVGNIICPADFPLGAHKRVVVISVVESPYIIVKHPLTFQTVDVVALNKVDLAPLIETDLNKLEEDIRKINSRIPVVLTSAKTELGISALSKELNL